VVYPIKIRIRNEKKQRKTYTKEFQIEALNLAKELGSYAGAARQLGITDSLLHSWKAKYHFHKNVKVKSAVIAVNEAEEIARLRKENEELKKVNYILKRASAFFEQDHLK
jgi:transposase